MGLLLIIELICVVIIIISSIVMVISVSNDNDITATIGLIFLIISGFSFLIISLCFSEYLYDYTLIESNTKKVLIDRDIIVRKLQETYNQDNLNDAIDFNAKQHKIKIENETFLQKYNTEMFYVDTIEIPNIQYVPRQKIELLNNK